MRLLCAVLVCAAMLGGNAGGQERDSTQWRERIQEEFALYPPYRIASFDGFRDGGSMCGVVADARGDSLAFFVFAPAGIGDANMQAAQERYYRDSLHTERGGLRICGRHAVGCRYLCGGHGEQLTRGSAREEAFLHLLVLAACDEAGEATFIRIDSLVRVRSEYPPREFRTPGSVELRNHRIWQFANGALEARRRHSVADGQ
jgi:hypothetical protein